MPTHDIKLPGNKRPQWPDRCVCCETEHPGHKAKIAVTGSRSTLGWTMEAADLAIGDTGIQGTNVRVKIEVPCCAKCAVALERRHLWKTVALYASGILGAAACFGIIVWGNAHGLSSRLTTFLGVVALLALVVAPVVYELRNPPAFTITPLEGRVTYEFASALCAEEFARANEDAAA